MIKMYVIVPSNPEYLLEMEKPHHASNREDLARRFSEYLKTKGIAFNLTDHHVFLNESGGEIARLVES